MIFYIKLKKLKKLNKRSFTPSFTILELVIVIIVIGILVAVVPISIPNNNLQVAADNLIKNIRFTQSLALKEDKYQPFPLKNNPIENNRSKYWFKQWWQIRFSTFDDNGKTHYWYEIFSDQPYNTSTKNFTAQANLPVTLWYKSIAKNPLNLKLLIGHCGVSNYPECNETDTKLDLTKTYGIKKVEFVNFDRSKRLVFDNFGNVFLREGDDGDAGDINPLDSAKRKLLIKTANIKLCLDNPCQYTISRCIQINITPTGYIYSSNCQ